MIGFNEKEGVLHADNIPLPPLAELYGTPAYIYSARQVRQNVRALQTAMADALPQNRQPLIAFACKANSNLAILRLLSTLGLGCDVVSGGEMMRATSAGIDTDRIVYSGVGKSNEEICEALDNNILQINIESKAELERIAVLAEKKNIIARIAFRLNPDVIAGTHDKISTGRSEDKFGLSRTEIETLYEWAHKHSHIEPQGLSVHIGSQLTKTEPFRLAFERVAALVLFLRSKDLPVKRLDLGGGLGIVYKDEQPPCLQSYAEAIRDIILPLDTEIILEPGRFITGNAGVLLTKVTTIKENETRRYLILDAAMNDLMRPALYEAYHEIKPVIKNAAPAQKYDIVGPVCETGDTFLKDQTLPAPQSNDLFAIMTAGAYGFVMASNYNTRPFPPEILVDGDKHTIIGQRQTVQDILERETIPDWLS